MSESASPLREPGEDYEAPHAPRARRLGRILIVDDFPDAIEMYRMYFDHSGYEVLSAGDGLSAVAMALRSVPDVIVMDLSLPGLDGWEATRRLKRDARTRHIPVVVLTGHALAGHSQGAMDAGCDAFITKPCLPERLLEEIRTILDATPRPRSES